MRTMLFVIGVAVLLVFGFVMYVRGVWGLWFSKKVERTGHLNYHELRERELYHEIVERRPWWRTREDAERQLEEHNLRRKT